MQLTNYEKLLSRYYKILSGKSQARFLANKAKLKEKIKQAREILKHCELCETRCGADRFGGEKGVCGVGANPEISSFFVHMGEEPFFVPSFTIFFVGCNFRCQFCQNWTISQRYESGIYLNPEELAKLIENRPDIRNINFVGGEPTPNLVYILETLNNLNRNIPVIWNSNFYMTKHTMDMLKNCVDVYLSDFKYGNDKCAKRLSKVVNYTNIVQRNHEIAYNHAELVMRHLVLPNHFECCTRPVLEWVRKNAPNTIVNIMEQYRTCYKAEEYPDINCYLTTEHRKAIELAEKLGVNYIS